MAKKIIFYLLNWFITAFLRDRVCQTTQDPGGRPTAAWQKYLQ